MSIARIKQFILFWHTLQRSKQTQKHPLVATEINTLWSISMALLDWQKTRTLGKDATKYQMWLDGYKAEK